MADSIEALRKLSDACLSRRLTAEECGEFYDAIRALSPAGGDWVMVPRNEQDALLSVVKESTYGGTLGKEGRAKVALQNYFDALAASPQQEPGATINVNEIDSKSIADPSGQTLAGAGGELRQALQNAIALWGHRCTDCTQLVWLESAEKALATSAGTTGDDSEDAARLDWLAANVTERLTDASSKGEPEYAEHKMQFVFPQLIAWADFCGSITLREAIDAARRARGEGCADV